MSAMRKAASKGEREIYLEVAQTRYQGEVNAYTPLGDYTQYLLPEQRLAREIADELRGRGISASFHVGWSDSRVGDSRYRDFVLSFSASW
jgi:hypothetical protein